MRAIETVRIRHRGPFHPGVNVPFESVFVFDLVAIFCVIEIPSLVVFLPIAFLCVSSAVRFRLVVPMPCTFNPKEHPWCGHFMTVQLTLKFVTAGPRTVPSRFVYRFFSMPAVLQTFRPCGIPFAPGLGRLPVPVMSFIFHSLSVDCFLLIRIFFISSRHHFSILGPIAISLPTLFVSLPFVDKNCNALISFLFCRIHSSTTVTLYIPPRVSTTP